MPSGRELMSAVDAYGPLLDQRLRPSAVHQPELIELSEAVVPVPVLEQAAEVAAVQHDPFLGKRLIAAARLVRWETRIQQAIGRALARRRAVVSLRALTASAHPDAFDLSAWDTDVTEEVEQVVEEILAEMANVTLEQFRLDPALYAKVLAQIDLESRTEHFVSVIKDIGPDVARDITQALSQGAGKGESIPQLADRVDNVFSMADNRAALISRTEVIAASNRTGNDAATAVNDVMPLMKSWLSTDDSRTREDHADADGQTVAFDDQFEVGGELCDYPGDESLSIDQAANCRCVVTYSEASGSGDEEPAPPGEEATAASLAAFEWDESQHPRGEGGKFGPGDGGSSNRPQTMLERVGPQTVQPLSPSDLAKASAAFVDSARQTLAQRGIDPGSVSAAAQQQIQWAKANDQQVTSTVRDAAQAAGAHLTGEDFRIKSEGSMERKLTTDIAGTAPGQHVTAAEMGGKIGDALRYTVVDSPQNLVATQATVIQDLESKGYSLEKAKNFWQDPGPYDGLNTQMREPGGHLFELQFHTPDSFALKESLNHPLYEESRLPTTSSDRRLELNTQMLANNQHLERPANIEHAYRK